jgi:hypothetical protein
MLDYGYRSKCCKAPIRIGFKIIKDTFPQQRKTVWVCTKCSTRDVNIIPKSEV